MRGKKRKKAIESEELMIFFIVVTLAMLSSAFLAQTPDNFAYENDGLDMPNHYKYASLIAKDARNIAFSGIPLFFHFIAAVLSNAAGIPIGLSLNLLGLFFFLLFPFSVYKLSMFFSNDKKISLLAAFFSTTILVRIDLQGILAGTPHRAAMALVPLILYFFLSKRFFLSGLLLGLLFTTHLSWPVAVLLVFVAVLHQLITRKTIEFFGITKFFAGALAVSLPYLFFYWSSAAEHASKIAFSFNALPYSLLGLWISPLLLPLIFVPAIAVLLAIAGIVHSAKARELFGKYSLFSIWILLLLLGTQSYFLLSDFNDASIVFAPGRLKSFLIVPLAFFAAVGTFWIAKKTKKETLSVAVVCALMVLLSVPMLFASTSAIKHSPEELDFIGSVSKKYSDKIIFSAPWLDAKTLMLNDNIIIKSGNSAARAEDEYLFFSSLKTFNNFERVFILANVGDARMEEFLSQHNSDFSVVFSNSKFRLLEYRKIVPNDYSLNDAATAFSLAANDKNLFFSQWNFKKPLLLEFSSGEESACISFSEKAAIEECGSPLRPVDFEIAGDRNALLGLLSSPNPDLFAYLLLWHFDKSNISVKPLGGIFSAEKKVSFNIPPLEKSFFLSDINLTLLVRASGNTVSFETTKGKNFVASDSSLSFFALAIKWANPLSGEFSQPNILFGIAFAVLFG